MEQITYFLQKTPEGRLVIDTGLNPEYKLKEKIQANSWVHAKYLLGYPLTNTQHNMLDLLDL